ncbi:protein of unknown function [Candidatus Promineifilum breve]|uniref:Uncharacterized protein n=2 Tax=Candidatus Promineifilum breve TaxID=1806508 RepID=A0A160T7K8_9CHLR|nr:protein of unknown function [Candidatus Promineifilum breve]
MLGATENKEKFLLWLRKREADGKDIAKKSVAPADATAEWRAVMVWTDDGGRVA